MSDRRFFILAGAAAALMVGLALAWPQGLGARSPWPFGHVTAAQESAAAAKTGRAKAPATAPRARLKGPL